MPQQHLIIVCSYLIGFQPWRHPGVLLQRAPRVVVRVRLLHRVDGRWVVRVALLRLVLPVAAGPRLHGGLAVDGGVHGRRVGGRHEMALLLLLLEGHDGLERGRVLLPRPLAVATRLPASRGEERHS